jgi:WD40 repeat protein
VKNHLVGVLLSDARFLMRDYHIPILQSGLHVYHSAFLSMPECSLHSITPDVTVGRFVSQRDTDWQFNTLVMEGHINAVASAVFSLDGLRIVSSSYDTTVRVWDAVSGTLQRPPESFDDAEDQEDNFLVLSSSHGMCKLPFQQWLDSPRKTDFVFKRHLTSHFKLNSHGWILRSGADSVWRRMCCLPVFRRSGCDLASAGQKVCIGSTVGVITILDFSNVTLPSIVGM